MKNANVTNYDWFVGWVVGWMVDFGSTEEKNYEMDVCL